MRELLARSKSSRELIASPTLLAANFIPNAAVDPFGSHVVPITKDIEILFKYYWSIAPTGSHFRKNEVLPPHVQALGFFKTVRDNVMTRVLSNEFALYGLMFTMVARAVHYSEIRVPGFPRVDHFLHLAISSLRKKMARLNAYGERAQADVIWSISSIALAEWNRGDLDMALSHLRAFARLSRWLDMTQPIVRFLLAGTQGTDVFVAVEKGNIPILPCVDDSQSPPTRLEVVNTHLRAIENIEPAQRPKRPLSNKHPTRDIVTPRRDLLDDAEEALDFRLGTAFEEQIADETADPLLKPILKGLIKCLTFAKYIWCTPHGTTHDADYMCTKARATLHRLCSLPNQLARLQDEHHRVAKIDCIRLALILHLANAVTRMSFRSAKLNVPRLREALTRYDQTREQEPQDTGPIDTIPIADVVAVVEDDKTMLWIVLTGYYYAEGTDDESWFLSRATLCAERLGLTDYRSLHEHMVRYLYSATKQKRSLETVALLLS